MFFTLDSGTNPVHEIKAPAQTEVLAGSEVRMANRKATACFTCTMHGIITD
jgi:hypothetical protein